MKIDIRVIKDDSTILEGRYDVTDAQSFGLACADMFSQLRSKELAETTSVGAMMDMLNASVLDVLDGATLAITST